MPVADFPPVRLLGPDDLPRCVALATDRAWAPERSKWELLLSASHVLGVDAPDGRGLAGSVTLTRWQDDAAAVGMMLVASRYGRRGLGLTLMRQLLELAGADATVTLFATDMGRPLYEKLGFQPVRRNVSFVGRFRPRPDNSKWRWAPGGRGTGNERRVRPAGAADLPEILKVDRAAFGADRARILTRLPGWAERMAVFETGDGVAGFAAAWRNGPASTVIGPLVAPDGAAAKLLVTALAADTGTALRLDLDPDRPELPGWADARGLRPAGANVVMAHGPLTQRGVPGRLFTPISVALA